MLIETYLLKKMIFPHKQILKLTRLKKQTNSAINEYTMSNSFEISNVFFNFSIYINCQFNYFICYYLFQSIFNNIRILYLKY